MPARKPHAIATLLVLAVTLSFNCGDCEDTTHRQIGDAGDAGDGSSSVTGDPTQPGQRVEHDGVGQVVVPRQGPAVDILWVIDNSASMCQEQQAVRDNFERMASRLVAQGVDFHMGVTTTQMKENFTLDPIAKPAQLQATPQPIPSTFMAAGGESCLGDEGDPNDPMDGFEPVRAQIAAAVGCTKDPSAWQDLLDVTDDEIACAFGLVDSTDCAVNNAPEQLFPTTADGRTPTGETPAEDNPYRQFPKVIRSSEYSAVDKVDIEKLSKDFACMNMVGTRGYTLEMGLGAAVEAVSPQMTGGAVESPTDESAPNHGLIRKDADFAVIFVSDENDCTHDGSLPEASSCGGDSCAFANNPDFPDSPLIAPDELAGKLMDNLAASKGADVELDDVSVAAITGAWKRYGVDSSYPQGDAPMDLEMCEQNEMVPDDLTAQPSCMSAQFGTAYSGDRYERFMRNFDVTYPSLPDSPDQHMPGVMCTPDQMADTLSGLGDATATLSAACVQRPLASCAGDADASSCAAYRFGDAAPSCTGSGVCDSAFALELINAPSTSALEDTGYCIAESIGADGLEDGCVVDRTKYHLIDCGAGGTTFEWVDPGADDILADVDVRIRYRYTEAP